MPMKLNVGLSRKVGEANYGSRGASVNLEQEVDATLINEPERLQERIREMFGLAKASIEEELQAEPSQSPASAQRSNDRTAANTRQQHANGRSGGSRAATNGSRSNGNGRTATTNPPPATASQVRALHAIANRKGLSLEAVVNGQYGVNEPESLTIKEASELIDELNGNHTAAAGGRR